ncbi:MAG: hypothetical protein FP813_02645 [Desulfurivibrio sp.]|nr:hypothetical protein [Desulfurivibrio sp.]MBU4118881.1 hypothetical protein [Pseudomonadota bacterium]
MKCKLCGNEAKLLKKSHIIPDFMYQDLFDEKHRYYEVIVNKEYPLRNKLRQSGVYEPDILCSICDNEKFGGLETYASQALYGGIKLTIENGAINSSKYTRIKGLDYSKFKLFLMSVWWRASISNLPVFQHVNLGKHEQIIRDKLLNNDPGSSEEYPCAIFTYLHHDNNYHPIIAEPKCNYSDQQQICTFLIGGNLFVFYTHIDEKTEWVRHSAINEDGVMQIVQMSENLSAKVVNKFVGMDLL